MAIVFLGGGTCRIPFIQQWIKDHFPRAKVIIDGQLEIITATGAAIHALQICSGEVEPYIKFIEEESSGSNRDSKQSDKEFFEETNASTDHLHSDKKL